MIFGPRRVVVVLVISAVFFALFSQLWMSELVGLLWRIVLIGIVAMIGFGVLEIWPRRLPAWLARWVLQVVAVAISVPLVTFWIYHLTTDAGAPSFWENQERMIGFALLTITGLLVAPWVALAALVRKKDAIARAQALEFRAERAELESQALDARLRLVQAQVSPHFLFNTLANVRELVVSGSDRAPDVLDSLIAYLRAAVPHLDGSASTLAQELERVNAYLELMQMRMPDRLTFEMIVDEPLSKLAKSIHFPPITLLTLVENAVKHGIDPAEEGGHIEVRIGSSDGQTYLVVEVSDSGVGLNVSTSADSAGTGLGTGLDALHERLVLKFGANATLDVCGNEDEGVTAVVRFPMEEPAS